MEWLSSIVPVRSFRLWLLIEKFSVIQLGPVEPLSKPVAQEYWWAAALWVAEELRTFAGIGSCMLALALAPSAGSRRPARAMPAPTAIAVTVLFIICFSLNNRRL
jgi:hypothetical protein